VRVFNNLATASGKDGINPIRKVHEINKKNNYTNIEIGSLQIFGGAKYGNI
jgi:hypothetical protein